MKQEEILEIASNPYEAATKYLLRLKEERERAGKLREALEEILAMQGDDFNIMNLSPVDMINLINEVAETALNNYK